MNRRHFLLAFGLALATPASLEARVQQTAPSFMYDIALEAARTEQEAATTSQQIRERLDALPGNLRVLGENGFVAVTRQDGSWPYRVFLNANMTREHASRLVQLLGREGIGNEPFTYRSQHFFNPNSTDGRYSLVFTDTDIGTTVQQYTTAFGSDEAFATVRTLQETNTEFDLPIYPSGGDIIPVPTRFLKPVYRADLAEGTDYVTEVLQDGESADELIRRHIAHPTQEMTRAILAFNGIQQRQTQLLHAGTPIHIPIGEVNDVTRPVVIDEITAPPTTEERRTTTVVPEFEAGRAAKQNEIARWLRGQPLYVLANTEMPAVLIELFNIQDPIDARHYDSPANMRAAAARFGQGIVDYAAKHPAVRHVIIDNGHGNADPGAINRVTGKKESDYTPLLQRDLAAYVRANSQLQVHELNFTGAANQDARLRSYAREANRIGDSGNSIYIATHIDSYVNGNRIPPMAPKVIVHGNGAQPRSRELAQGMLNRVVPPYCDRRPTVCR